MNNRREKGEVVVEASIIVTLVAIFITIMLYIGMVLYQQTLVSVMANQTASNIAQIYSNTMKDPFTGYVEPEKVYQSITYSNIKTDAYVEIIEQKAEAFAKYRLKSSRILASENTSVEVEIVKKQNEVFKSQIIVTIRDKIDVPLVGMFGTNGMVEFASSGRADCVDYLEYLQGVEAIGNPEEYPIQFLPDVKSCIVTFITDKYSGQFHAAVPVLKGESILGSKYYAKSGMPANPTYNNLQFTGWVMEDGTPFSASVRVNENITVYGTWRCTLNLDPTGGTVSPTSMVVGLKKTVSLPMPSRHGYEFKGWYTEVNGGGVKYESNMTEITSNVTLYAHWQCRHLNFGKQVISQATCQTRGKWKLTCTTCGYSYEETGDYGMCEAGAAAVTLEATCTSNGSKVASCKRCNTVLNYTKTSIPALGHAFNAYERAATCTQEGIKGKKCSRCGYEEGTKTARKPHNFNGRCGETHYYYNTFQTYCTAIKSNHTWSSGFQCITCSVCGTFQTDGPYCKRRKIKANNAQGWIYLYGSSSVWCAQHNGGSWKYTEKLKQHYYGTVKEHQQKP